MDLRFVDFDLCEVFFGGAISFKYDCVLLFCANGRYQ